jgi:D-inositol-3-phosphate glycosyltransferase
LRILFTSHYALPHLGGIETAIDAVARELARRGHEVTHVAAGPRRRDASLAWPERATPYRVVTVPALNGLEERFGVPWPVFSPRLLGVLRREVARADAVHAHGFLYMPTPAALALARRSTRRPARVLTEHVGRVGYESPAIDALERGAVATLGRAGARMAQAVVVLNDKVRAEVERLAPGRPTVRILNGVDCGRYRPAGVDERRGLRARLGWDERPRALFVGRLVAKKGVHLAVAGAARAGWELTVAGPGRLAPAMNGVEVLGPQPPERVAELYRAADAFVLPSRGEGFPTTAQEALASGLPVVLAEDASYGPYVEGAGPAVRLAAPTAEAVAEALMALARDGDYRAQAAEAAVAHARRRFSWRRAAEEHERLYERCLEG